MYWHQGCVNTATVSIQTEGAKVRIHICKGANTYFKKSSSKIFPAFARVRIQAPHVFVQKLIPQEFPNLLFLAFLVFLAFFLFKEFLAILSVFRFFPKDLRGSACRRNPCLLVVFLAVFQKGKEKKIRVFSCMYWFCAGG